MGPLSYGTTFRDHNHYSQRRTGSSAPKDRSSANKVRDYKSALAYLGSKYDRPLRYATRLRVVERRSRNESKAATTGVAVYHHGTPIIVWRKDGLTEFLAYDSVTTKQRLNRYLPFDVYSERGTLYAWYGWNDSRAIKSPRSIRKCRTCKGKGKHGADYCYGTRWYWAKRDNERCICGRIGAHNSNWYHGEKSRASRRTGR